MSNYELETKKTNARILKWLTIILIIVLSCVVIGMWAIPQYNVWQQGLKGQAELKRAEQNRQITIQEAMAKKESAKSLAEADVIRAEGTAKANEIIGESLKNNEAYLHWLWIDNIEKNPNAVIYIPTEANLPILEAGRLNKLNDK